MKKSALAAIVAFGVMPLSACSNGEQSAYMERPSIEANALEAEQAEQEFAELASQDSGDKKAPSKTDKKAAHKAAPKATKEKTVAAHNDAKAEQKKPSHGGGHVTGHTAEHKAVEAKSHETTPTRKVASVAQHGSSSSVWIVQLGAFRVKENAEKLTAKLKTGGYPVMMQPLNHSKNGELFIVSLEPTPNKAEAKKWQSDLKSKSFDTNIVFRKD